MENTETINRLTDRMRVFEFRWSNMADREWVSGRTIIEAIQTYIREMDVNISDFHPQYDDIVEIPVGDYDSMIIDNNEFMLIEHKEYTLKQWLTDNPNLSTVICGTMH